MTHPCIVSASIEDTLFDQLEFLVWARVNHGPECKCDDCLRFCRVHDILMEPFGEKTQEAVKVHQKKAKKAGA